MKTKEISIPAGLSGVMSYAHIEEGVYPVKMKKQEYSCDVIVKKATDKALVVVLDVSENLTDICNNFLFQLQAIEASGILNRKLVYYKN